MAASTHAQTLAQRNWAGSGVTVDPWWRRAVFYRINPATFQDSDGDGKGDLAGIAQRLDYLQSLGVDAVLLDAGSDAAKPVTVALQGFDDLGRAAVSHHLRVIVALGVPASQTPAADTDYLASARFWLNQGAAGLYVSTRALAQVDGSAHIGVLLHQLRLLTNSFPGGRVLMAGAPASADLALAASLLKETQLTAGATIVSATPTATSLRQQLQAALVGPLAAATRSRSRAISASEPVLTAARVASQSDTAMQTALQKTLATMLLASRSAVILDYGQELGMIAPDGKTPLMQWTPSNGPPTIPPPPDKAVEAPANAKVAYEGFHEYVPPPKIKLPTPRLPAVVESDDPQPATIDPNSLPGFTSGVPDASLAAANAPTANVAIEQADPRSMLNFYRQLIELHHDQATLRNGTETLLDRDADGALVWVRRPVAGMRSSATVVVACNLSAKPLFLTSRDLGTMSPQAGLRPMLSEGGAGASVAAHTVFLGEIR